MFSLKIKNRYLERNHIQRRASNSFSKCSNVSIVLFFPKFPIQWSHLVICSELLQYLTGFVGRGEGTSPVVEEQTRIGETPSKSITRLHPQGEVAL